jgi:hypothetical protein
MAVSPFAFTRPADVGEQLAKLALLIDGWSAVGHRRWGQCGLRRRSCGGLRIALFAVAPTIRMD